DYIDLQRDYTGMLKRLVEERLLSPNSASPSQTTQERQRTTESDNAAKPVHKVVKHPSEGNTSADDRSGKPGKKDEEDKTHRG
ncbi:MAG: hypothetical protein JNL51_01465, partial [Chitinophagaceae bacterium]|nr:hypothetical protein [Chitinophagaceae bacterium]